MLGVEVGREKFRISLISRLFLVHPTNGFEVGRRSTKEINSLKEDRKDQSDIYLFPRETKTSWKCYSLEMTTAQTP